jgi:hypothetical protein
MVLIILAASAVGVLCIASPLPGYVAKVRSHLCAQAVTDTG